MKEPLSEIELFLDNYRISWEYNLKRQLHKPEKVESNPILVSEYPWEELYVIIYGSVLPKEDGNGFRMWYQSGAKGMQKEQYLCYAESEDGIAWNKPMLSLNSYEGYKKTNILLGKECNIHGPAVVPNEHDENPDERYLLLFDSYPQFRPELESYLQQSRWCYSATSPDGIVWTPAKGRPAFPGKADCGQNVVWDPITKRYIAYARGVRPNAAAPLDEKLYGEDTRVRYVRASVSSDFLHWSEPVELLRADKADGDPHNQIHQFSVTRRGSQYIALISFFNIDSYVDIDYEDKGTLTMEEGTCETQLAVSRDGFHWDRVANRKTFLSHGQLKEWDSRWIVTAEQICFDRNRMLFYYAGSEIPRTAGNSMSLNIGVASSPADRFQALSPERLEQPAILETKPLYIKEGDLQINCDASHGKILVELCDFNGHRIDGFEKENCEPIETDSLNQTVLWRHKKLSDAIDNSNHSRRAVRIRFYIYQASLYAIYLPHIVNANELIVPRPERF